MRFNPSVEHTCRCKCLLRVILSQTVLVFLLVLAGCQNLRPVPDDLPPLTEQEIAAREARLAAFKPWRAFGSLVIDSEKEGVFNASFAWDVAADGFVIKLFGPLGLQQYQVSESVNGAELIADGDKITGYSAEYLLQQVLGVEIPLQRMQSWAVGLPTEADEVERDQRGRVRKMTHLSSAEWQIEYQRYRRFEGLDQGLDLPRSIAVIGEGVEIRLSIKKWLRPEEAENGRLEIPGISS